MSECTDSDFDLLRVARKLSFVTVINLRLLAIIDKFFIFSIPFQLRNLVSEFYTFNGTTKDNNTFDTNDISFLENYMNLDYISIWPPLPNRHVVKGYNVLPFYCDLRSCHFIRNQTRLFCPHGCHCEYENQKMRLEFNCAVPEDKTELRFELDIGNATLYMINTNATRLPNASVYSYYYITNLQLANNKLDELNVYHLPQNLTTLDIRNNSLKLLKQEVIDYIRHRNGSIHIKLSQNPWICECHPPRFLKFIAKYHKIIDDFHFIDCNGIGPVLKLDDCRLNTTYLILSVAFLLVFVSVFACAIVFWFKMSILMWLYDHNIFVSCILHTADNIEFHQKFDAFLAFSHKNLEYVLNMSSN